MKATAATIETAAMRVEAMCWSPELWTPQQEGRRWEIQDAVLELRTAHGNGEVSSRAAQIALLALEVAALTEAAGLPAVVLASVDAFLDYFAPVALAGEEVTR